MSDSYQERTERATPRRREKAREKGNVPVSKDLIGLIGLWMIYLYINYGSHTIHRLSAYLRNAIERSFQMGSITNSSLFGILRVDGGAMGAIFAPYFLLIFIFGLGVHFLQTGFNFAPASLAPDINRINPVEGVKKLFNLNTLFEAGKGVAKIAAFGGALYLLIGKEMAAYPALVSMDSGSIMFFIYLQVKKLFLISVVILSAFAVIDIGYSRWKHEKDLRMTRQEIKEEFKEMEGDPLVKARIKSLLRDLARRRMMSEVPGADFVVTNPNHLAVALKYDEGSSQAPVVVAKGANLIAERIKEVAKENGVPIFEDKPLARSLFKINLGQEIPEVFYKAVATILANVYRAKGKNLVGVDA